MSLCIYGEILKIIKTRSQFPSRAQIMDIFLWCMHGHNNHQKICMYGWMGRFVFVCLCICQVDFSSFFFWPSGIGISIDWWCSWFHGYISFSWKGLFIWHPSCKYLIGCVRFPCLNKWDLSIYLAFLLVTELQGASNG